jgi:hypothetical protein
LIAFVSGLVALGLHKQRMDTRTALTLFLSLFFGLMLFQSRRFIEYFPPFALIFSAIAWAPLITVPWQNLFEESPDNSGNHVSRGYSIMDWKSSRWLPGMLLILSLIIGIVFTGRAARENLQDTKPAGLYSQTSKWLVENTPQGTRIFQTDWDDFPRLFFHNIWNTYLIGLDPTFMQIKDPDLFDQWVNITRGEVELPAQQIFGDFAAQYVLTDLKHEKFIERAGEDPAMVEVFRDGEAILFKVQLPTD